VDDKEKPLMKDLYGGHTLFDSNILKTYGFSVHIFTKVLRTNDKTFQAALDVLRYGQEHRYDRCLQWLNKRYQPHNMPADMPIIATTNKKVDEANKKALESNPNEPMTFDMTISGKFDIKSCPADESITLKVGMPVITLTNEQNGLWSNGSYGHVTQLSTEGIYVLFKGNGEEHFVPLHLFEETETTVSDEVVTVEVEGVVSSTTKKVLNKEVIGSAFQLAVKPAAAFSVFRMQGRTLDVPALVDLGDWGFPLSQDNEWGWGQCYTALSRFRKVEDIYLAQPLTRKHIKPCRSAVSWVEAYVNS
ncbi:MAG: hypothetical protein GY928_12080, partial [Colwellia sp.]|nr:hypothetical protein [Colwellia sp.]